MTVAAVAAVAALSAIHHESQGDLDGLIVCLIVTAILFVAALVWPSRDQKLSLYDDEKE